MSETREKTLITGDRVSKVGGDYRFDGVIVSAFTKLSGAVRYVVEDDRGVLHVYSSKNLAPQPEQPASEKTDDEFAPDTDIPRTYQELAAMHDRVVAALEQPSEPAATPSIAAQIKFLDAIKYQLVDQHRFDDAKAIVAAKQVLATLLAKDAVEAVATDAPTEAGIDLPTEPGLWINKTATALVYHVFADPDSGETKCVAVSIDNGLVQGIQQPVSSLPRGGWSRAVRSSEVAVLREELKTAHMAADLNNAATEACKRALTADESEVARLKGEMERLTKVMHILPCPGCGKLTGAHSTGCVIADLQKRLGETAKLPVDPYQID